MITALSIVVLVLALFLVVAVLMQSGKDKSLSGSIAGGADTFFSQGRAKTWDKTLNTLTIIVAALFAVATLVMYLIIC